MTRLSRCLEEGHLKLLGQFETLLMADYFGFLITLGGHKQFFAVRGRVLINLLHPFLDIIKSELAGTVVSKHDALRAFVVGLRDGSKSFLAGSVPNLEFNVFSIDVH